MNEISEFNETGEGFLEEVDLDLLGWKENIPGHWHKERSSLAAKTKDSLEPGGLEALGAPGHSAQTWYLGRCVGVIMGRDYRGRGGILKIGNPWMFGGSWATFSFLKLFIYLFTHSFIYLFYFILEAELNSSGSSDGCLRDSTGGIILGFKLQSPMMRIKS